MTKKEKTRYIPEPPENGDLNAARVKSGQEKFKIGV